MGLNFRYSSMGRICSAQGLALVPGAMSSKCMEERWFENSEVRKRYRQCNSDNRDRYHNCSARGNYVQCYHHVTQESCGEDFARVAQMYVKEYSDNHSDNAVQC